MTRANRQGNMEVEERVSIGSGNARQGNSPPATASKAQSKRTSKPDCADSHTNDVEPLRDVAYGEQDAAHRRCTSA